MYELVPLIKIIIIQNAQAEQDRLELQHHMLTLLLDHRYLGNTVRKALQHPESTVIGTDLSLIPGPLHSGYTT